MGAALGLALDGVHPQVAFAQGAAPSGEIVFQSDREGPTRIFIIDLASKAVRRVGTAGAWMDEDPSWSPDGSRIAFASNRADGRNIDIYVMHADGSNIVRLTDHAAADQDPTWAADGQSLFFTSERNGRGEIFRVWLNDKRVERMTSGFSRAIMPAASPDGRYLAFAAQLLIDFQIELLDLKTGERRSVGTAGGACRPAFAPDSQEMAYVHLDSEPSRLEAVKETGRRTVIADRQLWSYYPAYSPDGRFLAFSVSPEHHEGEDWDLAITDAARPGAITKLTVGKGNDRVPEWRPK